ncbi:MAG: helix-turn-helix domain-containing protein [Ruminococcaceae bacterium]|nr:helix-turn-helix domain-containing protein [Oscillospiraceae bacterium]
MRENSLLEILRETDINISRAVFASLDERWNFQTTGSPHTRLYFVTGGGGFLKTKDQYVEMSPGNVYFIPPNCKFSCGCKHLEKFFFHINISTVEKYDLFYNVEKIYSMPFSIETSEKIRTLINSERYVDILSLKLFILKTVLDFSDAYSFEKTSIKKYSPTVQSVISYIEDNLSIKLTVEDISRATFVSESKIRNSFKKEMNMPIGKYIDDMIFIKAREMLSKVGCSISEVSAALGFCDQFYFSRRFKEKFGRTPSDFKKINKIY